LSYELQVELD